jgi:hypothetical protein
LISRWAEKEGIREGTFDVITCASAFVLIYVIMGIVAEERRENDF